MLQSAPRGSLPWQTAFIDGAGVLIIPGQPEGRVLWRSLQNAMDNLPAAWPIYVAGGATALETVAELFPVEVEVDKITLDDLGDEGLNEVRESLGGFNVCGWISSVLLRRAHPKAYLPDDHTQAKIRDMLTKDTYFYDKLPGENWLFFSVRYKDERCGYAWYSTL